MRYRIHSHKERESRFARPKNRLRWGRIFFIILLLGAVLFGLFFLLTAEDNPSSLLPTANATVQPAAQTSAAPSLPGDIFASTPGAGQPVLNHVILEAVDKRAALDQTQQNITDPNAPPYTLQAVPSGKNPFAGKDLTTVTAELATQKFIAQTPKQWGEHLPGITDHLQHVWQEHNKYDASHGINAAATSKATVQGKATIALTLDACGGGKGDAFDAELIQLLQEHHIPATLFLTTRWMKKNMGTVKELRNNPLFEIAAHGTAHKPLSLNGRSAFNRQGTKNLKELVQEVESNARYIEEMAGKRPRWFRSGTAHYDEISIKLVHNLGLGVAGYSIAGDEGATLNARQVAQKLLQAKDGDIILLHMNQPESGTTKGVKLALPLLLQNGFSFVRLSET